MRKTYREGDRITITKEMVSALRECGEHTILGPWLRAGRTGVCYAHRLGRDRGHLCIEWEDGHRTNVYSFEKIGLRFEHPEFEELTVTGCPEGLLSVTELVVLGLVETGFFTESGAWSMVDRIKPGMEKYGVVFYRP